MKISDRTYKMSKPLKIMLALMRDQSRVPGIKRAMIEAEVAALRYRNSRRSIVSEEQ